ncbi:hypothetical protein C0Q70_08710 [Pomacea canaliculata]|uniref:Uncharacterized protein n=1 Tax=Pomacea canaliculata TaxID=400727 RepID=A0A2T7P7S5_POMCA|nr:hypothetical protein C0Q70_08710 [Pomacea canaliculata]
MWVLPAMAYRERRDVIDIVASFYNRRQQSEEAVIEYAATQRNLQAKANCLLSDAISSTHLATRFVKGLKHSQVRRETSRQLADHGSSFTSPGHNSAVHKDVTIFNSLLGLTNTATALPRRWVVVIETGDGAAQSRDALKR